MNVTSRRSRRAANSVNSSRIASKRAAVVVDEVHLVDADDEVRHAEQRHQQAVAAGLLDDAVAGVDEHDRQVGGRRAGDRVARVLHVAGAVGDDEVARRRREVAVGDVDRDALLALGAQAVGQQGEVDVVVAAPPADRLDVLELVLEDRLGVVQQPADQRRLAVVDAADGGEAQRRARWPACRASRHRTSLRCERPSASEERPATACVAGERHQK